MEKPQNLLIAALIISLVALGLSVYSSYSVFKINKKISAAEKSLEKMDYIIERIEPLVPQMEILNESLPKIEQYILGLPPLPEE